MVKVGSAPDQLGRAAPAEGVGRDVDFQSTSFALAVDQAAEGMVGHALTRSPKDQSDNSIATHSFAQLPSEIMGVLECAWVRADE